MIGVTEVEHALLVLAIRGGVEDTGFGHLLDFVDDGRDHGVVDAFFLLEELLVGVAVEEELQNAPFIVGFVVIEHVEVVEPRDVFSGLVVDDSEGACAVNAVLQLRRAL